MQIKILVILAKKRSSKKIHNLETIKERGKRVDLTTQKFQTINTKSSSLIITKILIKARRCYFSFIRLVKNEKDQ